MPTEAVWLALIATIAPIASVVGIIYVARVSNRTKKAAEQAVSDIKEVHKLTNSNATEMKESLRVMSEKNKDLEKMILLLDRDKVEADHLRDDTARSTEETLRQVSANMKEAEAKIPAIADTAETPESPPKTT